MRILARDAAEAIHLNVDGSVRRRLTDDHELDIYIVVDSASRVLALEIHQIPEGIRLPEVEVGDVIDVELFESDGILRIGLLSTDYADVFYVLVDDLVDSIIRNPGLEQGSRAVMLRLRRWERLLESSINGMTAFAQKGLFGELRVLVEVADAMGIVRAVESWQGPEGGTRDFGIGGIGVEVKTTSGKGLLTVRISSERQLEVIAVERLYLWCVSIEKSEKGHTLNDMVDRVRELIGSDIELLDKFVAKLMCVGFHTADRNRYTTQFIIRGEFVYRIEEGFPRITSADVPNCVFEVGYSIDLEACEGWLCDQKSIWGELENA